MAFGLRQLSEVFNDLGVVYEDASVSGEVRTAAIGYSAKGSLLFVVHIERENYMVRIVSARAAETEERRLYEDGE